VVDAAKSGEGEHATVTHVLDGVQCNAQLAVVQHDGGGAVRGSGVAAATAVRRHVAGVRAEWSSQA
jgi:hypothetical protein